jgi:hypothetical protein
MFQKTVTSGKYVGVYTVYESHESLPSTCLTKSNPDDLIKGDYVIDLDGIKAPIIDIIVSGKSIIIVTPYGFDAIGTPGYGQYRKFNLLRERLYFAALVTGRRYKKLKTADITFIRCALAGQDIYEAYKRIYKRPVDTYRQKYTVKARLHDLMFSPQANEVVATMLKDHPEMNGLDAGWFLQRLKASVPDTGLEKPVQLEALKMLGRASGDKEIIEILEPSKSLGLPNSDTEDGEFMVLEESEPTKQLQE